MIRGRLVLAAACTMTLAACATTGAADVTADQVALAPLPTVGGVGVLPSTVVPEREPVISVPVTRPVTEDGTTAELVGDKVIDNRVLVIGDSIMASTATRYSGLMCDALVPLGWAVEVEAEPSRFIDFGNRVLDRVLDPVVGTENDWDAAAVFLGSNYGRDQQRYEDELRVILVPLGAAPDAAVHGHRIPAGLGRGERDRTQAGGRVRQCDRRRLGADRSLSGRVERRRAASHEHGARGPGRSHGFVPRPRPAGYGRVSQVAVHR